MTHALIDSIQVGLPQDLGEVGAADPLERPWTSAIVKRPVGGPVRVARLNIEGDGQADLENHGGPDMAVLAYSADHYPLWRNELPLREWHPGAFGENLTIRGITEHDVCIGDLWRAGDVLFEVSQPRQPCWKLARRWKLNDLPKRVVQTGRSGWYLRVQREGTIEPDSDITLVQRPHASWTVARVSEVVYSKHPDPAALRELAQLDALSESWRVELRANSSRLTP